VYFRIFAVSSHSQRLRLRPRFGPHSLPQYPTAPNRCERREFSRWLCFCFVELTGRSHRSHLCKGQWKLLKVSNSIMTYFASYSICSLASLPPSAGAWLLPADFSHLALRTSDHHDPEAPLYMQWITSVKRSMPLAPACIEGPPEELPSRLRHAFDQACARLPPTHTKQYIAEKQEVLQGLGLQIANLGLSGSGLVSQLLLGQQPINLSNVDAADYSSLRSRHALEALDCVFFITAIFFSVGHIGTPHSSPASPVSWVPYTIPPSSLPPKLDRVFVPELAHRAMRFRDHKARFNFSPSVSDPDAKASGSPVSYWTNCAGIGGRGITSHLSALVLKLLRCRKLFEDQVWISFVPWVARFSTLAARFIFCPAENNAPRGVGW